MNNKSVTSEDRINFIHLMTSAGKSNEQKKRFDTCIRNLNISDNRFIGSYRDPQKNTFESLRKYHSPDVTANFLALLSAPSGLKFLTHDFDPNSDMNMNLVIEKANEIINSKDYHHQIPGSLYNLFNRFINGDKWLDYKGTEHSFHLKSEQISKLTLHSPTLHPITSVEFGDEINTFRNTLRISKPNLYSIFKFILSNNTNLRYLRIHTENLNKADFYTNVFWVTSMIFKKVLNDIAQRDENAEVNIEFSRSSWQEYRLCSVKITHVGSEANPFDETKRKLMSRGGAMFNIMSACFGYCDWTIEANFEGDFKRWRILNFRNLSEEEFLDSKDVEGFTHVFTFYKK